MISNSTSSSVERAPQILPLAQAKGRRVGGKAAGLAELIASGLRVPAGFVVQGARPGRLPEDLGAQLRALGEGPVAVRSSALDEDGGEASWAGQFETILNVEGEAAVREAIEKCLSSLSSDRAAAYSESQQRPDENAMGVVVQRMVDARAAGVLFTVDPVTSRRAHAVIDAVEGLGESLVSGLATPDHYVVDREFQTLRADLVGDSPILDEATRRRLLEEAFGAEAERGEALDFEWAIDGDGQIWWLQARPITTLSADLNELDTALLEADHVYTRCNVGEMFPGACTPLSFSLTARGIDVGMQMMHQQVGIQGEITSYNRFIAMFYGHLFLNLTTMSDATTQAGGTSAESLCLSICGRRVEEPEIKIRQRPSFHVWFPNALRYIVYRLGQRRARAGLRSLAERLHFDPVDGSALAMWEEIDRNFDANFFAMDFHLISSAGAGVLTSTLLRILAKGEDPTGEHHAEVAAILAGAKDVESADIAAGAVRMLEAIVAQPDAAQRFADVEPNTAVEWLRGTSSGAAGTVFGEYLARHGHRAIKELELRQAEWREDPTPLVVSLQASVRARLAHPAESRATSKAVDEPDPIFNHKWFMRWLIRLTRQTVCSREETKSGLVDVTVQFKVAYRELGHRLVAEGLLADMDAVFFLTHQELGELLQDRDSRWGEIALARRAIHEKQDALRFPDVFAGVPVPIDPHAEIKEGARIVKGSPVSRGKVVGIARIVHSAVEAEALQEGEILIAPITDVGWTPYFNLISGLVTDVGSAVSHGAVVAREYGLPAVVNTQIGTQVFQTGDRVVLDGDHGVVRLAEEGD